MRIFRILFIFGFFSLQCMGDAIFIPNEEKGYFPGDFITGTLNFEKEKEEVFSQIKGKKISNKVFVFDFKIKGPGKGDITIIPLSSGEIPKDLVWEGIKLDFSSIVIGKSISEPKGFIILDEVFKKSIFEYLWLFILILTGLITVIWILWKIKKNKNFLRSLQIGKQRKISFWKEKIIGAKERKDFENIYFERKQWTSLLGISPEKTKEFFNTLNKYQFKRNWSEIEFNEIKESFLRFKDGI